MTFPVLIACGNQYFLMIFTNDMLGEIACVHVCVYLCVHMHAYFVRESEPPVWVWVVPLIGCVTWDNYL